MALDLQISTQRAQAAIAQIEASLVGLRAQLDRFSAKNGLSDTLDKLATTTGVNPAAASSIRDLGASLRNLENAVQPLNNVAAALRKLSSGSVEGATRSVRSLSAAIAAIRNPAGVGALNSQVGVTAQVFNAATAAATRFKAAVGGIGATSGFTALNNAVNQVTAGARGAGGAANSMGISFGNASSFAKGLGISLGGLALAKVTQDMFEVVAMTEKFNAVIGNLTGAGTGAKEMEFLQAVAGETATDIKALTEGFTRWHAASLLSGKTAAESGETFRKLSVVMRSLGLGADQTKGAMRAFTQMMQKGKITAEELNQQLADHGVPALASMARAMNTTPAAVSKMMEQGKLGITEVGKLIDQLVKDFGGSLPAMLMGVEAQLAKFKNSLTNLAGIGGTEFFAAMATGANMLNKVLEMPAVASLIQNLGTLAGVVGGVLLAAVAILVNALAMVNLGIQAVTAAVVMLVSTAFQSLVTGITTIYTGFQVMGQYIYDYVIAPFSQAGTAANEFATFLQGVGIAIYNGVIDPIAKMLDSIGVLDYLKAAFQAVYDAIALVIAGWKQIFEWMGIAVEKTMEVANANSLLTKSVMDTAAAQSVQASVMSATSKSASDLALGLTSATDANAGLSNSAEAAADKVAKVKNAAHSASSSLYDYADSADSAANAQSRLNAAAASYTPPSGGGGGGGGGLYTDMPDGGNPFDKTMSERYFGGDHIWDSWSGGGLVDEGSKRGVRAPLSAFVGAPHFAGGGTTNGYSPTLPGGGIPAVLHGNEAVVPLTGGGEIPIAGGGGGGGPVIVPGFDKLYDCMLAVEQNQKETTDTIRTTATLMLAALDKIDMDILALSANVLQMARSNNSSGGGGGTRTTGTSNQGSSRPSNGNTIGVTADMRGGAFGGRPDQHISYGGGKAWVGGPDAPSRHGAMGGYATGSPNASKDPSGGFQATLHPNEAVIPLPDGRSVPVDLSNWEPPTEPWMRGEEGSSPVSLTNSRERVGPGASSGGMNVVINVTTPDAESFRKSEDQMMQDLGTRLRRARVNIGEQSSIDDPTRRRIS